MQKKITVINVGIFERGGKSFPWRFLDNGKLQIFYDDSVWRDVLNLDAVITSPVSKPKKKPL